MIEAIDICKRYGSIPAVSDISFRVEPQEVVGLLGPNGAGKSTTMRILTGYLPPTSGRASVAGFDVTDQPTEVKRRIGYLPEQPPLYPEMRVRDYLDFVASIKLVPRAQRPRAVDKAIERCGLTERAKQRIEHLSKGYRQRVGIAQAIVHEPQLAILDEPTVGLDPQQVIEVRRLIRTLAEQKMTILVSSHILSEVEATCGRVIIINRGRLIARGTPHELQAALSRQAESAVWIEFGGAINPVIHQLKSHQSIEQVDVVERREASVLCKVQTARGIDGRNDIARLVLDAGGDLLSLRRQTRSLEDAFLHLTSQVAGQNDIDETDQSTHDDKPPAERDTATQPSVTEVIR